MPDILASQVAAGEVVERPASVVKELVENSIDAGARRIEVRIDRGGLSLIRVTDDGSGMAREDALLSLERHATSKIRSKDDLRRIVTLGFRGEALPSIASVSRFLMTTRPAGALAGTAIRVDGGRLGAVSDAGDAPGTTIEVRSLFHNVPARRKFLRSEATEFGHIEQQVRLQAVAHPEIAFSLVHNGRVVFQLPSAQAPGERIRGLVGVETASRLVPVAWRDDYLRIEGFVGEAGLSRSSRASQFVFVNRRPVENQALHYGLREGYRGALPKGSYPVVFLFLEIDPEEVDFNVHPAKKEIRLRSGLRVRDSLSSAVARALAAGHSAGGSLQRPGTSERPTTDPGSGSGELSASGPGRSFTGPASGGGGAESGAAHRVPGAPVLQRELLRPDEAHALRKDWSEWPRTADGRSSSNPGAAAGAAARAGAGAGAGAPAKDGRSADDPDPADDPDEAAATVATSRRAALPSPAESGLDESGRDRSGEERGAGRESFDVLGVLDGGFVILKGSGGLVLMDQRAAHERVLYERYREQLAHRGAASQPLLVPITLELGPRDYAFVRRNLEVIQRAGVGIEGFGANTVKIDTLPALMRQQDPAAFMDAVIHDLRHAEDSLSSTRLGDDDVAAAVSRMAVRHGDPLTLDEIRRLIRDLLACEMPYCCPQGRPTLVQISRSEIEKKFGRAPRSGHGRE